MSIFHILGQFQGAFIESPLVKVDLLNKVQDWRIAASKLPKFKKKFDVPCHSTLSQVRKVSTNLIFF